MATETTARIAIVDDDESVREAIAGLLRSLGLSVKAFPSAIEFLSFPAIKDISCLIADIHMPRMTGVELHRRLGELGYSVPTILITAYPDDAMRARALADGVICYLGKPFDDNALITCVNSVLDQAPHDDDHP